jgi:hypothetical protein
VISQQYAEDTILFVDKNEEYAENLKWILNSFKLMSDMRTNFHKSELFPINIGDLDEVEQYAASFGCPVGNFLSRYPFTL